jgi:hypothetical protein
MTASSTSSSRRRAASSRLRRPEATTSGCGAFAVADEKEFASPACAMSEADPAYMGFLPAAELAARLNVLLEAERAGAKVLLALMRDHPEAAPALEAVQRDEGRYAGLLARLVRRLGGVPSDKTGDFVGKVLAEEGLAARLQLLNRGQAWVMKRLDEILPRIAADDIHRELAEMRERHARNIDACTRLLG